MFGSRDKLKKSIKAQLELEAEELETDAYVQAMRKKLREAAIERGQKRAEEDLKSPIDKIKEIVTSGKEHAGKLNEMFSSGDSELSQKIARIKKELKEE